MHNEFALCRATTAADDDDGNNRFVDLSLLKENEINKENSKLADSTSIFKPMRKKDAARKYTDR